MSVASTSTHASSSSAPASAAAPSLSAASVPALASGPSASSSAAPAPPLRSPAPLWRVALRATRRGSLVATALWLTIGLVSAAQTWWIGFASFANAAVLSLLEWGPWILFSPLVIFFANLLPITGRSWKWAIPLHLATSLGIAAAINAVTLTTSRWWMPPPAGAITFINRPADESVAGVAAFPPPAIGRGRQVFGPAGRRVHESSGFIVAPPDRIIGPGPKLTINRGPFDAPVPRIVRGGEPPPLSGILLLNARLTLPIYWLIVVGVLALRHHGIALEREGRALRAERELVHARLAALQSQLQPHFLFNSLNAISAFISRRPAAAEDMVVALSTLLRSVLRMSERTEIPLREELDFARRYLAVHRIRFEDTLRVSWWIAPETDDALVPTLLLQPLIENALEHGLRGAAGELEISAHASDQLLLLAVTNRSDDLAAEPSPARDSTRLGLRNTRQRLETLFGANYRLELHEVPGGARAEIELPLRTVSA